MKLQHIKLKKNEKFDKVAKVEGSYGKFETAIVKLEVYDESGNYYLGRKYQLRCWFQPNATETNPNPDQSMCEYEYTDNYASILAAQKYEIAHYSILCA